MLLAGLGHKDFYRLDPASSSRSRPTTRARPRRPTTSIDRDKARRLLKDAGYAGQPLRWIVTTEYEHHYKACARRQEPARRGRLQDRPASVRLATVVQRRAKPELWDVFSTAFVFVPEPTVTPQVPATGRAGGCSPEKTRCSKAMGRESDLKKRQAIWEKVQTVFYAEAPRIKIGDYFRLDHDARTSRL